MSNSKHEKPTQPTIRQTMTVIQETPACWAPFGAMDHDGKWLVVSDEDESFIMEMSDAQSAYYAAELLNRGFRMGYQRGDFEAKQAMRTALGLA